VNGKVKLSLCLTMHHVMKTHILLKYASLHEDVLKSGGVAAHILNLVTSGCLASSTALKQFVKLPVEPGTSHALGSY
jgi:hypothetical protein